MPGRVTGGSLCSTLIHPGKCSRRKTDLRDAGKLSKLLWLNGERVRNGQKPQDLRRVVKNKAAQILTTAPGGGMYSTLAVASRIGSIERFARPRSLTNDFGLSPGCRNSGEATDRLRCSRNEKERLRANPQIKITMSARPNIASETTRR